MFAFLPPQSLGYSDFKQIILPKQITNNILGCAYINLLYLLKIKIFSIYLHIKYANFFVINI